MIKAEQLKLPLFADEIIEAEISVYVDIKFRGLSSPHHSVFIHRANNTTYLHIAGLNLLGQRSGTLFRFLSEPGIFPLPFDVIIADLNALSEQHLIEFSANIVKRHWRSEFHWNTTARCFVYCQSLS
jgi:hypothetical protein